MKQFFYKLKKNCYNLLGSLLSKDWLKNLFKKRNETKEANNGFRAGLIVGILHTLYVLIDLGLFKEKYIEEITKAMSHTGTKTAEINSLQSLSNHSILLLGVVILPFFVIGIYSIVGLLLGIFYNKYNWINNVFVLIIGFSLSSFFVSDTYMTVFIDLFVAIILGLLFFTIFNNRFHLKKEG